MQNEVSEKEGLCIPHYRSDQLQHSIKYHGVKVWNSIPLSNIKKLPKQGFFLNKSKKYFVQLYA